MLAPRCTGIRRLDQARYEIGSLAEVGRSGLGPECRWGHRHCTSRLPCLRTGRGRQRRAEPVPGLPKTATAATVPAEPGQGRRRSNAADPLTYGWDAGQHRDHRRLARIPEHDSSSRASRRRVGDVAAASLAHSSSTESCNSRDSPRHRCRGCAPELWAKCGGHASPTRPAGGPPVPRANTSSTSAHGSADAVGRGTPRTMAALAMTAAVRLRLRACARPARTGRRVRRSPKSPGSMFDRNNQRPEVVQGTHFRPLVGHHGVRGERSFSWVVRCRPGLRPVAPSPLGRERPTGWRRNRLPGRPFRCPCRNCARCGQDRRGNRPGRPLRTAEGSLRRRTGRW